MLPVYAATYPNETIRYKASDMVLHVDPDAVYLVMSEARSFYNGHFYLSYWPSPKLMKPNPEINVPIHTYCKTIRNVVSSVVESETYGTFNTSKAAILMWPALIILDHKQLAKPLKTNNSTTEGFLNSGMKPKRSKTWDMKWHWLRDKDAFEQMRVY